jgi:hypothetical protein
MKRNFLTGTMQVLGVWFSGRTLAYYAEGQEKCGKMLAISLFLSSFL